MLENNDSKPSATHPIPHTMLLLDGTFCSTLNGGGGALEFYTNNRFARTSPVFNNFLHTFVPNFSLVLKVALVASQVILHFRNQCFFGLNSANSNKAYELNVDSNEVQVYCHMTNINGCGSGGWTLAMKIDGSKVQLLVSTCYCLCRKTVL